MPSIVYGVTLVFLHDSSHKPPWLYSVHCTLYVLGIRVLIDFILIVTSSLRDGNGLLIKPPRS